MLIVDWAPRDSGWWRREKRAIRQRYLLHLLYREQLWIVDAGRKKCASYRASFPRP